MGTDIHWFVEQRDAGAQWVLLDGDIPFFYPEDSPLVYRARNYEMYGALAGIRGLTPQEVPTRGLPNDVSPIVAACREVDPDCVAASWATLAELEQLEQTQFSDPAFRCVLDEIRRLADAVETRVIFWFDR